MALLDHKILTFDCYGTLIDWETGILNAVRAYLPGVDRGDDEILETFARSESEEETAAPTALYPEILARVHGRLAEAWNSEVRFSGTVEESAAGFGDSVKDWPAFPDSGEALKRLHEHFQLAILSNIDRRSFRASQERLGVEFDFVFTAEDIGSYKPDPRNFEYLLEKLAAVGIAKEEILHTAQSLFHDHVPASRFGLATCWIDRRHAADGWGATMPPPEDVQVDHRFTSLGALADAVEKEAGK